MKERIDGIGLMDVGIALFIFVFGVLFFLGIRNIMHNSKPSESSIQGEAITTEVTSNQTNIINVTEYELVPRE